MCEGRSILPVHSLCQCRRIGHSWIVGCLCSWRKPKLSEKGCIHLHLAGTAVPGSYTVEGTTGSTCIGAQRDVNEQHIYIVLQFYKFYNNLTVLWHALCLCQGPTNKMCRVLINTTHPRGRSFVDAFIYAFWSFALLDSSSSTFLIIARTETRIIMNNH